MCACMVTHARYEEFLVVVRHPPKLFPQGWHLGSDLCGTGLKARAEHRVAHEKERLLVKNRVFNQWDVSPGHDGSGREHARRFTSWTRGLWSSLPKGSTLPDQVWAHRHRAILVLLWLHVPGIFLFSLAQHVGVLHGLSEATVVAVFAWGATAQRTQRRVSTVVAALGLMTCSAVLVHLSGGVIEMHFHYFVKVAVVTLYQDWQPFLIAIGYVVLQHGVVGALDPTAVYNHQAAIDHPWQWAGVHGLFILGMSAAGIASWRLNESPVQAPAGRGERLSQAPQLSPLASSDRELA